MLDISDTVNTTDTEVYRGDTTDTEVYREYNGYRGIQGIQKVTKRYRILEPGCLTSFIKKKMQN